MPSPPTLVRRPSSVKMSSRTTRAMEPLDTTASFRAMLLYTCRPSRSTDTSSIIRDSTVKRPWARSRSRSSSLTSSSDMKPRLPRFTPSTGTLCSATVRARCRMVPSPPKAISRSAWRISCCKGRMDRPSSSPYPSRWKGRQTEVCIPRLSSISRDCLHTFSSLSRYGLGQSITRFGFMPLTSVLQLAVGRLHDLRQREVARGSLPVTKIAQIFDVPLRPPDGGISNSKHCKVVFLRKV